MLYVCGSGVSADRPVGVSAPAREPNLLGAPGAGPPFFRLGCVCQSGARPRGKVYSSVMIGDLEPGTAALSMLLTFPSFRFCVLLSIFLHFRSCSLVIVGATLRNLWWASFMQLAPVL